MKPPVKTEYRGQVFRSKTEAIFARLLDMAGYIWEYEPEDWRTDDGWVPDFWVVMQGISMERKRLVIPLLVEIKPAQVTASYLHALASRYRQKAMPHNICAIVTFNPFEPSIAPTVRWLRDNGEWAIGLPFMDEGHFFGRTSEAKRFRFDLESAA